MTRKIVDKHIEDRNGTLYVRFKDGDGKWRWKTTGLPSSRLIDARRIRDVLQNPASAPTPDAPMTVQLYGERWLEGRRADGISTVKDDESRLKNHFYPRFGTKGLRDVLPHQIKGWVAELKATDLAPATIINIYTTASSMFSDAEGDGLIERTPFNRRRDRLPKKRDKDPGWRRTAKFEKKEIELLLSPTNGIPEDRRVFYALMFLGGGMRFGEVAARRLRDIKRDVRPLWRLEITSSYNTKLRKVKTTKTDREREVPVHPLLQSILQAWLAEGWPRFFGRFPTDEDLIIPSRRGKHRNVNHMLRRFKQDCERLGLRPRRQHDLRRTFYSLCLDAGANKDRIRWVLWGRPDGVEGDYDQASWAAVCGEVMKLQVTGKAGQVIELPKAVGETSNAGLSQPLSQPGENEMQVLGIVGGADGTRRRLRNCQEDPSAPPALQKPGGSGPVAIVTESPAPPDRPDRATFATRRKPYEPPAVVGEGDVFDLAAEVLK